MTLKKFKREWPDRTDYFVSVPDDVWGLVFDSWKRDNSRPVPIPEKSLFFHSSWVSPDGDFDYPLGR